MSQLAEPIESEAEVVVTEGVGDAELLLSRYTDLQLVLSPCICDNLPIVLTVHERSVRNHCPEEVIGFIEEGVTIIARKGNLLGRIVRVPTELVDVGAKVEHLQAKPRRLLFV